MIRPGTSKLNGRKYPSPKRAAPLKYSKGDSDASDGEYHESPAYKAPNPAPLKLNAPSGRSKTPYTPSMAPRRSARRNADVRKVSPVRQTSDNAESIEEGQSTNNTAQPSHPTPPGANAPTPGAPKRPQTLLEISLAASRVRLGIPEADSPRIADGPDVPGAIEDDQSTRKRKRSSKTTRQSAQPQDNEPEASQSESGEPLRRSRRIAQAQPSPGEEDG